MNRERISMIAVPLFVVLCSQQASAFTGPTAFSRTNNVQTITTSKTKHAAIVDPSVFSDAHHHVDAINSFFSTMTLSDAFEAASSGVSDAVASSGVSDAVASSVVADATAGVTEALPAGAVESVPQDNGPFGFLVGPIGGFLNLIHTIYVSVGLKSNAWGVSIITLTCIIKLLTYPLTAQQMKGTVRMQAIQPKMKELQAKYQSNPDVLNQKMSELYQKNDVNPLAGCIPALVQIPVFLGLYRSVLALAKINALDEPFLFLPSLEGPTYGADPTHASDWILKGWQDGAPSLGWADTSAFLILPIALIISQAVSMQLMQSKDQEQPAYLKFLPLLFGWFSVSVPSALGIYWFANNVITTALTLQIKSSIKDLPVAAPAGGGGATVIDAPFTPISTLSEKPSGFGTTSYVDDDVKPITPVDAEIVASDLANDNGDDTEGGQQKKRGGGKRKKKKKKKRT